MINAARSVLVLQRMTSEIAQEFRIEACDRKRYFSVYDDKNNKAPPAIKAEWYEFVGIDLGNGDDTGPEPTTLARFSAGSRPMRSAASARASSRTFKS
jgi:hypothetical protein